MDRGGDSLAGSDTRSLAHDCRPRGTAVAEIAEALSRGYDVKVKDAELESMTEPPGFRDLDA
jgi:hypothetical protein